MAVLYFFIYKIDKPRWRKVSILSSCKFDPPLVLCYLSPWKIFYVGQDDVYLYDCKVKCPLTNLVAMLQRMLPAQPPTF